MHANAVSRHACLQNAYFIKHSCKVCTKTPPFNQHYWKHHVHAKSATWRVTNLIINHDKNITCLILETESITTRRCLSICPSVCPVTVCQAYYFNIVGHILLKLVNMITLHWLLYEPEPEKRGHSIQIS